MRVDLKEAATPLRKLRTLLKDSPADPSPNYVHKLRTQTRRLEATVHALSPHGDAKAQRLLTLMKPVRKAAGKVRDMDVLIGKVPALTPDGAEESLVRLTEHMAAQRERHAARLRRIIKSRRKEARRRLKEYGSQLQRTVSGDTTESFAAPQKLATQLQHWPRLHAENLHEFRIQAKELQYMLKLAPGSDRRVLDAFAKVKDAAGDWHDWLQLSEVAEEVLESRRDGVILRQIRDILHEKLRAALSAGEAARRQAGEPLSLNRPRTGRLALVPGPAKPIIRGSAGSHPGDRRVAS